MTSMSRLWGCVYAVGLSLCGCADSTQVDGGSMCGPMTAHVARVIDGDTLVLAVQDGGEGEHVRLIGVDAPELHGAGTPECGATEAAAYLRELVDGQDIALSYDPAVCRDRYGRLLAYVDALDGEPAPLLLVRGLACKLHIPPAGDDRASEFAELEADARHRVVGLWSECALDLPDCAR